MAVILKITIRNAEKGIIDNALKLVEEIKTSHPNLLQQIEVAIEC